METASKEEERFKIKKGRWSQFNPEKEVMGKMEEEIISQFGAEETGKLYKVVRSFMLDVRFGPLVPIPAGATVRLKQDLAMELFNAGRIEPELPGLFEAVRDFVTVDFEGNWMGIKRGDVVKMPKEEALDQMRKGNVKERRAVE